MTINSLLEELARSTVKQQVLQGVQLVMLFYTSAFSRAIHDIQPGEEVTISYTGLLATRPERRELLLRVTLHSVDLICFAGAATPGDVYGLH